jgi:hypothetical protein
LKTQFKLLCVVSFLACSPLFVGPRRSLAQNPPEKHESIDVKKYGWQPLPSRTSHEWAGRPERLLEIDHKGRILVGYTSRDRLELATRDNPTLSFHILSLNSDGSSGRSYELPTTRWFDNGLYLDSEDDLIVKANDVLQARKAESGDGSQKHDWKILRSCSMNCRVNESVNRNVFLLDDKAANPALTFARVSDARLEILRQCPELPRYDTHSFDNKYAYYEGQPTPRTYALYRWPLCEYAHAKQFSLPASGRAIALNKRSIALVDASGVQIVTSEGQLTFHWTMPKGDAAINQVSSSEDGKRFALQIITFKGGSRLLDVNGRIVARRINIYDSETGISLAALPIAIRDGDQCEFTISPDGSKLAVMINENLELFQLPAEENDHSL